MILSARFLTDVCTVNSWNYGNSWVEFVEGEAFNLYFQLVDLTKDSTRDPPGRRYMPASGATLSVVIESINDTYKITRGATQAYSTSDPSIWYVSLLATDTLRGTHTMRLTLTEGTKVTYGKILSALRVQSKTAL